MSIWLKAMLVAGGGALGALSRWGVAEAAFRFAGSAPLGTFIANLLGCLLIGMAKAAVDALGWGSPELRLFGFTGFLGAFTTFSTFEADVFGLWRVDERGWAVAYMFGSVAGGFAMFLVGWWLVQKFAQ